MQKQVKIKVIGVRNYESSNDVIDLWEWRHDSIRFFSALE